MISNIKVMMKFPKMDTSSSNSMQGNNSDRVEKDIERGAISFRPTQTFTNWRQEAKNCKSQDLLKITQIN